MAARRKQASIAALLIVLLVSIATLVLVLFGAFDFATELRDQRGAVRTEATLLADQLAVSLALPVWNFDHDQIIAIMASLMKDADVFAVSVRLSDKRSSLHALVRNSQWAVVQTMRFESEEGLGTTVRVSFPVPGGKP